MPAYYPLPPAYILLWLLVFSALELVVDAPVSQQMSRMLLCCLPTRNVPLSAVLWVAYTFETLKQDEYVRTHPQNPRVHPSTLST